MNATLRGGLIGCGFFADNHLHAWRDLAGVEIVAVCDTDLDKARAAAAAFDVPDVFSHAEAMLRETRLDFVDIVTTVESHRPLVQLAAAHGLPMICQKPFATVIDDAAAMVEAAARAGVPLMVHENFRWQRPHLEAGRLLREGRIGEPFFGRLSFRHDYDVYANQPYLADADRFAILDVGIHLLDLARFYFGEVVRLSCRIQSINPRVRGEDVVTMLLEHGGGATCVVDISFFSHIDPNPFPETLVEIDGSVGSLRVLPGRRLRWVGGGETSDLDVDAAVGAWMEAPWHIVQDSVLNVQAHWLDCLRTGRTPDTSGADNLETLRLGLAAYEAAASASVVRTR